MLFNLSAFYLRYVDNAEKTYNNLTNIFSRCFENFMQSLKSDDNKFAKDVQRLSTEMENKSQIAQSKVIGRQAGMMYSGLSYGEMAIGSFVHASQIETEMDKILLDYRVNMRMEKDLYILKYKKNVKIFLNDLLFSLLSYIFKDEYKFADLDKLIEIIGIENENVQDQNKALNMFKNYPFAYPCYSKVISIMPKEEIENFNQVLDFYQIDIEKLRLEEDIEDKIFSNSTPKVEMLKNSNIINFYCNQTSKEIEEVISTITFKKLEEKINSETNSYKFNLDSRLEKCENLNSDLDNYKECLNKSKYEQLKEMINEKYNSVNTDFIEYTKLEIFNPILGIYWFFIFVSLVLYLLISHSIISFGPIFKEIIIAFIIAIICQYCRVGIIYAKRITNKFDQLNNTKFNLQNEKKLEKFSYIGPCFIICVLILLFATINDNYKKADVYGKWSNKDGYIEVKKDTILFVEKDGNAKNINEYSCKINQTKVEKKESTFLSEKSYYISADYTLSCNINGENINISADIHYDLDSKSKNLFVRCSSKACPSYINNQKSYDSAMFSSYSGNIPKN